MSQFRSRVLFTLALTVGAWVLVVPAASAYIDGSSASIAFQALIGFIMAAGVGARMFWGRIRAFFAGDRAAEEEAVDAERP